MRLSFASPTNLAAIDTAAGVLWLQVEFDEVRFYAKSSAHNTVIHFKTWSSSLISYLTTGKGSWDSRQMIKYVTLLDGHTAALPLAGMGGASDQTDSAATTDLMTSAAAKWSIGGTSWAVDDMATSYNNTLHQIWVRPKPVNLMPANASAVVHSGDQVAAMSYSRLDSAIAVVNPSTTHADGCWPLPLEMDFYMLGVNQASACDSAGVFPMSFCSSACVN